MDPRASPSTPPAPQKRSKCQKKTRPRSPAPPRGLPEPPHPRTGTALPGAGCQTSPPPPHLSGAHGNRGKRRDSQNPLPRLSNRPPLRPRCHYLQRESSAGRGGGSPTTPLAPSRGEGAGAAVSSPGTAKKVPPVTRRAERQRGSGAHPPRDGGWREARGREAGSRRPVPSRPVASAA